MGSPFFILSNKGESQIIVTKSSPILVPKSLFDLGHVEDYLRLQYDVSKAGHILQDEIEDYISISYLDKTENDCLTQLEPRHYQHITTFLYNILHRAIADKAANCLCLSIQDECIHFFLEKDNRLQLVNDIAITSDYDILYHALNILKQYGLDPDNCVVYLHNGSESLAELLSEYTDVTLLTLT